MFRLDTIHASCNFTFYKTENLSVSISVSFYNELQKLSPIRLLNFREKSEMNIMREITENLN